MKSKFQIFIDGMPIDFKEGTISYTGELEKGKFESPYEKMNMSFNAPLTDELRALFSDMEADYKKHLGKLEYGFSESIDKGGYVMVYNKENKLLGISRTTTEFQDLMSKINEREVKFIFVKPDGYIVDSNIKVEL